MSRDCYEVLMTFVTSKNLQQRCESLLSRIENRISNTKFLKTFIQPSSLFLHLALCETSSKFVESFYRETTFFTSEWMNYLHFCHKTRKASVEIMKRSFIHTWKNCVLGKIKFSCQIKILGCDIALIKFGRGLWISRERVSRKWKNQS